MRDVSVMGVAVLAMVIFLLVLVRTTASMADAKTKLEDDLSSKLDDWYVDTGTVSNLVVFCFFPAFARVLRGSLYF